MIEVLDILRLIGGFIYLMLGGDLLVRGALGLSRKTSISPVIVGLTIVAFGTSAPEFVISVYATATGFSGVALGNVVGSNIANILLVLGIPAVINPIVTDTRSLWKHTVFMVVISIMFVLMILNGVLSRIEGAILLSALIGMLVFLYKRGTTLTGVDKKNHSDEFERVLGLPSLVRVAIGFLFLGAILLPLGANLTVDGATAIAKRMEISDVVIGSTVVALGTSLPELATTVIAAFHRSSDMALGNVVGSNVFNILLVGGASAMVAPLPAPPAFLGFDVWVMLGSALVMLAFVLLHGRINRISGAIFFTAYVGYVTYLI
ncbi:MAG: calcium/sodium antiporter [Gammaproteobacteria bacterium]|nr:calcium/sodium antiporter [Gammaproteobacteria bacterium]